MAEEKRQGQRGGEGRLAREDRAGRMKQDLADVEYDLSNTSNPYKLSDPEGGWIGALTKKQQGRLMMVGGVAGLLLVALVWNVLDRRDAHGKVEAQGQRTILEKSEPTMVELATAQEVRVAAEKVVRDFMEASSAQERVRHVVPSPGVEERMQEYYQRPDSPPPNGFGEMHTFKAAAFDGVPLYWSETTEAKGGGEFFFNIVPLRDRMLIEWDSSVVYGELPWARFVELKSTKPVQMRVELEASQYYNHQFADDRVYEAFTITGLEFTEGLYGYVERDSAAGRQLGWVSKAPGRQQFNVGLQWVEGDAPNSVQIVEVLHHYWAEPTRLREELRSVR